MIMAPEKEEREEIYTVSEVARKLKVSDQVVRNLIASGELRSKRVGRQYRVTREMLDEYLNKQ